MGQAARKGRAGDPGEKRARSRTAAVRGDGRLPASGMTAAPGARSPEAGE